MDKNEPAPAQQPRSGADGTLRKITAIVAIVGATAFGIHSLAAAWVYDPLGIQPRDVGLSSGTLLAQTSAGLVAALMLLLVLFVGVELVRAIRRFNKEHRGVDLEASEPGILSLLFVELKVRVAAATVGAVILWIVAALGVYGYSAVEARESFRHGERPRFIPGFPAPWRGEVAFFQRRDANASSMDCALYLGQADGIVVMYDASEDRTLRVPASTIRLELDHDRRRCP